MPSNYSNWYLVPISFWSWPILGLFGLVVSYLVLQACISLYWVSDKCGALLLLYSHKNAVAHMKMWGFETKGSESSPKLHHEHCHGISVPFFSAPHSFSVFLPNPRNSKKGKTLNQGQELLQKAKIWKSLMSVIFAPAILPLGAPRLHS